MLYLFCGHTAKISYRIVRFLPAGPVNIHPVALPYSMVVRTSAKHLPACAPASFRLGSGTGFPAAAQIRSSIR